MKIVARFTDTTKLSTNRTNWKEKLQMNWLGAVISENIQ